MSDLPDWTKIPRDERRRILTAQCDAGLTAQKISDQFQNCSRSAVIGLVHRLKLQLGGGQPRKGIARKAGVEAASKAPKKPPATKRASKLVQETSSWRGANNPLWADFKGRAEQRAASPGLPAHLVTGEARRPICDLVPVSRNLKLVELTERTCKWPIGDPQAEDFGFCGTDAAGTGPYCRYHARISYQPPTTRQRAGLRSAERIS
ncbi:GcrA cell cycle regulator [Mesorhizobium sp. M1409]|uniref:GcrA family cell cycle regulator n=1 Tax=Mesorhizobium sp. M1409 TaxID=2957100 RepID=UPI003335EEA0